MGGSQDCTRGVPVSIEQRGCHAGAREVPVTMGEVQEGRAGCPPLSLHSFLALPFFSLLHLSRRDWDFPLHP